MKMKIYSHHCYLMEILDEGGTLHRFGMILFSRRLNNSLIYLRTLPQEYLNYGGELEKFITSNFPCQSKY